MENMHLEPTPVSTTITLPISWSMAFARAFALVPVAAGVAVFLYWLITRESKCMLLGAWVLITTLVFMLISLLLLSSYFLKPRNKAEKRQAAWTGACILSGLLITGLCIAIADDVLTRINITVDNQSSSPIAEIVFFDWAHEVSAGSLAVNSRKNFAFYPKGEAPLSARLVINSTTHTMLLSGYITQFNGDSAHITISPDGKISVKTVEEIHTNRKP